MKKILFQFTLSVVIMLFYGCQKTHEYNLGIMTTSKEYLRDVNVLLVPQGKMGATDLNYSNGKWLRHEIHWPVPQEIQICFRDQDGKKHKLQTTLNLSESFKGDVVIIIHQSSKGYELKKVVGKLGELDMDKL